MKRIYKISTALLLTVIFLWTFQGGYASAKTRTYKYKNKKYAVQRTHTKGPSKKSSRSRVKLSKKSTKHVSIKSKKRVAKTKIRSKKKTRNKANKSAAYNGSKVQNLVSFSKKFLGVRYVFGGESPSGFDCSGFTSYVYKKAGVNLPHHASGQYLLGQSVSRGGLKPGDLVFFQTYEPGISHVGIYIGGNRFIHAANGGVQISSLSESYYKTRYRGAKRI